jgi:ankyrin repeat protein
MNRWQFNALYMSVDTPEILDRLLAGPAAYDVNTACGERQEVPLHLAAVIGSGHAILALLASGANINARTIYNENALWLTAWQGHTEVNIH